MDSITLHDLNEYIRRVVALNLPEPLWVRCEIAQTKANRGHIYLELVEKEENSDQLKAQASAVVWNRSVRQFQKKIGKEFPFLLQEGLEVLLKVEVDFHEVYGLKLVVSDIDPTYTLGKLELNRRAVLETLRELKLLEKNKKCSLPTVIQRIAVISSPHAAGLQDYIQQLSKNDYGYSFQNTLFPAAMQGNQVEKEIVNQFKKIDQRSPEFDCIVIIRGGGAKLDLSAFDNLVIAQATANASLPVLTGIGHEIDETVLDKVAHLALKTPTAVADFFIHRNLQFEAHLLNQAQLLKEEIQLILKEQQKTLAQFQHLLRLESSKLVGQQNQMLEFIGQELPRTLNFLFKKEQNQLSTLEKAIELLDPKSILNRGFSLTTKNGKRISSVQGLNKGDTIKTYLKDGSISSKIT